jgi:hypothetical protein
VNDPFRLGLDATLVGVALLGVMAFILFDRPRFQVGLMFFIALAWGVELTIVVSRSPIAPGLYQRLHPLVSLATTLAAVVIVATRARAPKA